MDYNTRYSMLTFAAYDLMRHAWERGKETKKRQKK